MNKILIPLLLFTYLPLQSALEKEGCFFPNDVDTQDDFRVEKLSCEIFESLHYPYGRELIFRSDDNELNDIYIYISDVMKEKICACQCQHNLSFDKIVSLLFIYEPSEPIPFRPISPILNGHGRGPINRNLQNETVSCEIRFKLLDGNTVLKLFKCDDAQQSTWLQEYSFVELSIPKVISSRLNLKDNASLVMIAE